jgi:acyl-CoA thioesterase-1
VAKSVRLFAFLFFAMITATSVRAEPMTILALGDSLTAGYGLAPDEAFPVKLEAALKAKGFDVRIINAGVSGDTASAGRDRLDWALTDEVDAVIVELGANDALRGVDPKITRAALEDILKRLAARQLPVLLAGMKAPRNLGPEYAGAFDPIFPELAKAHGAGLYPFFLEGVATNAGLNQGDGIHPNAKGVDTIVSSVLPDVEKLISGITQK